MTLCKVFVGRSRASRLVHLFKEASVGGADGLGQIGAIRRLIVKVMAGVPASRTPIYRIILPASQQAASSDASSMPVDPAEFIFNHRLRCRETAARGRIRHAPDLGDRNFPGAVDLDDTDCGCLREARLREEKEGKERADKPHEAWTRAAHDCVRSLSFTPAFRRGRR